MMRNQVVLITGASRGIGAASAMAFARAGAKVAAAARDRDRLAHVAARIRSSAGGTCLPVAADVRDEASVRHMIGEVLRRFGRIDILINNAGVGTFGPTADVTLDDWDTVIGTNLKGALLCARETIPAMHRQGGGHIINVASQAGQYGFPQMALYCASKYGLIGLSESLGRELASSRIRVSYLCPGWVDTGFLAIFPREVVDRAVKSSPQAIAGALVELANGATKSRFERLMNRLARRLPWCPAGWKIRSETYSSF